MNPLKIKSLIQLSLILFTINSIQAQAPICLENWEGECPFNTFIYNNPEGKQLCDQTRISSAPLEGSTSLQVNWNLAGGRFCGLGIDLTQGSEDEGFDASLLHALSFQIKLIKGNEQFSIAIKDMAGIQPRISSDAYLSKTTNTQVVTIPLIKFGPKVDLTNLRDVNFSFSKATASKKGSIIIDDFKFVYKQ
jgi:hypothetical protein